MTFEDFSRINRERAEVWHPGGIEEWSVSDWACAMAGEAGEVCNAVKKLRRLEDRIRQSKGSDPQEMGQALAAIAEEIADTVIYADLLASRIGFDLGEAVREKFDRTSEQMGFPERL